MALQLRFNKNYFLRCIKGLLCTVFLLPLSAFAFDSDNGRPIFYTEVFNKNIHSLQCENFAHSPYYPIIELGSNQFITLKFDDFSPDIKTYAYRIVHCNAIWQADELSESQYIDGFTGSYLSYYETSQNTFFVYTHFELKFPNEEASPSISGNYVIVIYETDTPDVPVATARFMVVQSVVNVQCKATAQTDIDVNGKHQQLGVTIDYPEYNINQPSTELKVVVQQNRRLDNQVILDAPTFYERHTVNYKMNKDLIFEAGNEFRTLDISARYVLDRDVKSIDYYKPYYHTTLYPSQIRATKQYESWRTVNGRYIINMQSADNPDIEGDYFFTHFTLPMELPYLDGKIYILSQATGYRFDKNSVMSYNYETNEYEAVLLLKQGGYNYMYVYVPNHSDVGSLAEVEGEFWQTGNEYVAYVYYRPFGSLYDMLIGYGVTFFK